MARAKPFGVFLVFPQIAQICTDAVRGGLIPQIAPGAADATDAVRVLLVFHTDCAVGAKV